MKKLLLFIFLAFLFSCEKEEIYCWKCVTKIQDTESSIVTCPMTYDEMKIFKAGLDLQALAITGEFPDVICDKVKCEY